ncbi:MAG: LysR family transcriptional regulator [Novosphingobium sp.]
MAIRNKNLNLIPILQALLKEESVARAAEVVGLSQPAMSGALARLRETLNDPLLVRSGRSMLLTPKAQAIAKQIDVLCSQIDVLFQPDVFDPATADASFRVATPDYLAFRLARRLVPMLAELAPGIRMQFVDVPGELPAWMDAGNIDLAVCGDFGFWPDLLRQVAFRERYVATVACDHPLASRREVSSDELLGYPSPNLVFDPGLTRSHPVRNWITGLRCLDYVSQVTTMSQFIAILLALEPPSVARTPASLVELLIPKLPLRLLEISDEDASFDTCLFWSAITDQSISHRWLRETVCRALSDLADEGHFDHAW